MSQAQPKGLWYLTGLYICEYFSFFGVRAILVIYLIENFSLTDIRAYAIYGAFTGLVPLAPIFGGIVSDKLIGFKNAIIIGCILLVSGFTMFGFSEYINIFYAMAFTICGYGLFRSNVQCLLGSLYTEKNTKLRGPGFVILFIGGNLGGFVAAATSGFIAYYYSWNTAFIISGIGMFVGLCVFLSGLKHFTNDEDHNIICTNKFLLCIITASFIILFTTLLYVLLEYMLAGYMIAFIAVASSIFLFMIWKNSSKDIKKKLNFIFLLMLFGTFYWIIEQQMGSSITVFIKHNINLNILGVIIPAPIFTSMNFFAIIVGGSGVAWYFARIKNNSNVTEMLKFSIGITLLTLSFLLIFLAARMATVNGLSSPIWIIIGLFSLGFSELFIDPIALAKITSIRSKNTGFIVATYSLFTGALANFLASKVAGLSTVSQKTTSLIEQAKAFESFFGMILVATIILMVIWLLLTAYAKFKSKDNKSYI